MYHQEFGAAEELRDTIQCFWYTRREADVSAAAFEVMPDGYAEIVFHFGGPCRVSVNSVLQPLPSPFLMGLLDRPMVFHAEDRLEIIGVRCFPWTVFDLLGLPSGKDGLRIFEHPIAKTHASLAQWISAGNVMEAIAELQRYFLGARSHVPVGSMLNKAGIAMRQTNGTMPVNQVAAAAHATVRTLERNFKRSSGHTVKDVSALMRFEQVRNHLWTYPDASLAGLSQELGYADQSHLTRDFKRYSGITPASFARKARNGKGALSSEFVAFVQA